MFDTIFKTISDTFRGSGVDSTDQAAVENRNYVSNVASLGKIGSVALAIIAVALAVFSLMSGGFFGFLGGFTMSAVAIAAKDAWTTFSNIKHVVDGGDLNEFAVSQFREQSNYTLASALTQGTWLIQPIALLFVSRRPITAD